MLLEHLVEELGVLLLLDERQHGRERRLDVTVDRQVDGGAAPEVFGARVDLHGAGVGQELVVREVGAEHDHEVGVFDALSSRAVAEQAGHADVERVVVLDEVLAAQRVPDRRLDLLGERDELFVRTLDAGAAEDGDRLGAVDLARELTHDVVVRRDDALRRDGDGRDVGRGLFVGDVTGQRDDGDAADRHGVLDGGLHDARALRRRAHEFGVDAALGEEAVGVGLLEVALTDLGAGNVAGDRQNRRTRAVGVVEAVDEVEVPRAARARAHGEFTCHLRVRAGGEGCGLLVTNVDPVDAAASRTAGATHRIDDRVETVAHDSVDAAHPCGLQLLDDLLCQLHPYSSASTGRTRAWRGVEKP